MLDGPEMVPGGHHYRVLWDFRSCQSLPPNAPSSCEHCGYMAPKDLSFGFLVILC